VELRHRVCSARATATTRARTAATVTVGTVGVKNPQTFVTSAVSDSNAGPDSPSQGCSRHRIRRAMRRPTWAQVGPNEFGSGSRDALRQRTAPLVARSAARDKRVRRSGGQGVAGSNPVSPTNVQAGGKVRAGDSRVVNLVVSNGPPLRWWIVVTGRFAARCRCSPAGSVLTAG
jgi:hypothetical protein